MEHKNVSLADRVFERLESDLLGGRYQRGELLTEHRLVEDLGVSRTPIREALRRLEQEHIVEIGGRGILVIGVSEEDVKDIFDIRLRIEGEAAALAAKNADPAAIGRLGEALELQEYYVGRSDADHIRSMDSRFHELVYLASGSVIYADTLLPLHKKVQKYRKLSVESGDRAAESAAEHREIYEAIERGDAEAAARAMTAHVQNARDHILQRG